MYLQELHNLYFSPIIIQIIISRMKWTGLVAYMGEMRKACTIFVTKPERKKLIRRSSGK
jgi:hypothetical protein